MTAVLSVENWMSVVPFKHIFGKLWKMEKEDFFAIMLTYKHHTLEKHSSIIAHWPVALFEGIK